MKKALILFVAVLLAMVSAGTARAESEVDRIIYLSVGYGVFVPGSDYEPIAGNGWEKGTDVNLSFVAQLEDLVAAGIDLHYANTEISHPMGIMTVNITGFEPMVYIQKRNAKLQPYGAIGVGFYFNSISGVLGPIISADIKQGMGLVLKGGARYFITDKFFLGGSLKLFSDEYEGEGETSDFGGSSMNIDLGFAF